MADRADGSIRINTKLDNEGFEKGSSRLQKALQSLRDTVLSISGQLNNAFGLSQLRSGLQDTARSMQEFKDDVEGVQKTMASMDMADTFVQAQDTLDTLARKIKEFKGREYRLDDGRVVKGGQTEQYQKMVDAYGQLKSAIDNTDESQKNMIGNYQDMAYFAQKFQDTAGSMEGALTLEQTADVVAEMRRQMEAFGNMDFTFAGKLMKGTDTAGFKQMKTDVEAAELKLQEMAHSPAWNEMAAKWNTMPTLSGMAKNAVVGALTAITSKAIQAGYVIATSIHHPLQAIDRIAGAAAKSAGKVAVNIAKIASGPAIAGLKAIANGAKKAAGKLLEMAKAAAVAPFKRLGDALSNVFKKSSGSMQLGLGSIIKYGLGLLGLKAILGKLKSAATEGFGNLLKYDANLAATVNSFKASLETLKNSLGAAFAPIAQVVLPILTRLINALSQAISYVGMFIASLTGQTTFKRAVAQQGAAADAANATADAYDNAAEAAKKEKKTIASFDELHILDQNEDAGKGGKGGAGPAAGAAAFEDVPIDSKIDDLAKKLKEMWDLADFTELGRRLGEGLKNLLDSIPWDYIQAMAAKLGKSLATFLNGFLEVPGLFLTIGRTIAEAINTLFSFLYAFVSNLHWDSLGYALRDGILGLLYFLDWDLIYATFAQAGFGLGTAIDAAFNNPEIWTAIFEGLAHQWEALLLFLYNLISTPDWAGIAQNIGIGLNAGVEAFPWDLLASTLAAALNMVFTFAYNFLTTFDFFKFGKHIGDSITKAVRDTDWKTGGAALGAALNALFDTLNGLLEGISWGDLGKAVIDFIGGFFETIDTSKWGKFVSNLWTALCDFLTGALKEVDWEALPGQILDKIVDFFKGFDWDDAANSTWDLLKTALGAALDLLLGVGGVIASLGEKIGQAITDGIGAGLDAGWDWLTTKAWNLASDIFNAACDFLGINSPSKEFAWVGAMLTEGLAKGIDDTQDAAVSSAEALAEAVTAGAQEAKPTISVDTVTEGVDNVLTTFADKVTGGFADMIAQMEQIAAGSSFYIPAAAAGAVAPYSARQGSAGGRGDILAEILDRLTQDSAERLTRSDLREILDAAISENMDINFYIGDEQVARHANAGNARINRRYSPIAE